MKHVVSSLPLWCSHSSSSLSDANELLTGMPHPTLMPQPPKSGPEELHRYTVGRTQPMSVGPRQTRGTRGVRTRVACRSVIWWLVRPLSRRPTKCGRRSYSTSKLVGCTSKRVRERGRVSLDWCIKLVSLQPGFILSISLVMVLKAVSWHPVLSGLLVREWKCW